MTLLLSPGNILLASNTFNSSSTLDAFGQLVSAGECVMLYSISLGLLDDLLSQGDIQLSFNTFLAGECAGVSLGLMALLSQGDIRLASNKFNSSTSNGLGTAGECAHISVFLWACRLCCIKAIFCFHPIHLGTAGECVSVVFVSLAL